LIEVSEKLHARPECRGRHLPPCRQVPCLVNVWGKETSLKGK
jgi:hypothetical protein